MSIIINLRFVLYNAKQNSLPLVLNDEGVMNKGQAICLSNMGTYLVFFIIIFALLAYIIYLHVQLTKKNLFIDSAIKRLYGADKTWSNDEMMSFLHEIRKVHHYGTMFNDKLFEEKPLDFLLENEKDSKIFIHYTREEEVARNIIKKGFMFADSFYKTALPVNRDRLDLLMKHNSRKSFGDYLIILNLGNKIADRYTQEIEKNMIRGISLENLLTETQPTKNENGDLIYLLPNRFVKGYINHQTGEIIRNPEYDPNYDSSAFIKNLEFFRTRQLN